MSLFFSRYVFLYCIVYFFVSTHLPCSSNFYVFVARDLFLSIFIVSIRLSLALHPVSSPRTLSIHACAKHGTTLQIGRVCVLLMLSVFPFLSLFFFPIRLKLFVKVSVIQKKLFVPPFYSENTICPCVDVSRQMTTYIPILVSLLSGET